eukprot:SAG31_NODE_4383_length_3284_cov_1.151962_2_plen_54_part_00
MRTSKCEWLSCDFACHQYQLYAEMHFVILHYLRLRAIDHLREHATTAADLPSM